MKMLSLLILFVVVSVCYADEAKLREYQIAIKTGDIAKANMVQRTMNDEDRTKSIKLYKEWKKQQEIAKKKAYEDHVKKMMPARKAFAKGYEQDMLNKGCTEIVFT